MALASKACTWWTSRTSCHAFSQIHPDIKAYYVYIYSSYVHVPNRYHYSVLGYRKEKRHFKQKTLLTFKKPSLVTLAQHIPTPKTSKKRTSQRNGYKFSGTLSSRDPAGLVFLTCSHRLVLWGRGVEVNRKPIFSGWLDSMIWSEVPIAIGWKLVWWSLPWLEGWIGPFFWGGLFKGCLRVV